MRWYRTKAGMTLREFARQAGVNHSIVSRVEQGSQHAPPRVLNAYREILDLEVRGSEVVPAILPFNLTIEVSVYCDEWWLLRLAWSGHAERHRIKPELIVDGAGWSADHLFTDNFGRSVEMVELDPNSPQSPHRHARPVVLSVPDGWVDAYSPFEEAWITRPPRQRTALRFAMPSDGRADTCRLKFFLHSFSRTIVWFDDALIARPEQRLTVIDLGPLEPGIWHKLSWGRLNNQDFGGKAYLYGVPRERERAAAAKGWIRIDRDLWEDENGATRSLDDL